MSATASLAVTLSNKGSNKGALHGDSQLARILADMCRQGERQSALRVCPVSRIQAVHGVSAGQGTEFSKAALSISGKYLVFSLKNLQEDA